MMADELLTALALVLVIEGALYALFPEHMQRAMAMVMELPPSSLRLAGLAGTVTGVALVWLIRR